MDEGVSGLDLGDSFGISLREDFVGSFVGSFGEDLEDVLGTSFEGSFNETLATSIRKHTNNHSLFAGIT